ncbi:MAG: hypothetical protein EBU88_14910, partial [Acidobacteria bacterium]|nr:hypothetical protein [Acidobacteriota bacterium]
TASLNGQSLKVIGTTGSGTHGKFLRINLVGRSDFKIREDKNVIEVQARDAEAKTTYRTTFVLLSKMPVNSQDAPVPPAIRQIECRSILAPAEPGIPQIDKISPHLEIETPAMPIDAATRGTLQVRIKGRAFDSPGEQLTLRIGRKVVTTARLKSPTNSGKKTPAVNTGNGMNLEASVDFEHLFELDEVASAVMVEVRDRHDNIGLCTIPVIRPTVASSTGFTGRKFALIVGVSEYGSSERGLSNLSYAHRDAQEIENFLKTPQGGQFKAENIVRLTNKSATLAAVRSAVERFLTAANEDDLIYFFLAGHGAPDPYDDQGNYYFLLHDSKVSQLSDTAYPMREIGEFLGKQSKKVRLISFIDTCHSAGIQQPNNSRDSASKVNKVGATTLISNPRRGVGKKPGRPPAPQPPSTQPPPAVRPPDSFSFYAPEVFKQPGWLVITSTSKDELAQESSRWGGGHGVFTWTLLKGLRDGEADKNNDCLITADELSQFVRSEVKNETSQQQTPQVFKSGRSDIELASSNRCK